MTQSSSVTVAFDLPMMTAEQYDHIISDLAATGAANPGGHRYHIAYPKGDGWYVLDVWDSAESLDHFGGTLMSVLQKNGVVPPQPQIQPVYNFIVGS